VISVVLCVHNGEEHIEAQLESLARQDFDGEWELVIVDDRSTDSTVDVVARFEARLPVRVVSVVEGSGLSNARNVGIAAALGDFVMFCDADDVADPRWLSELARGASDATVVGGHLEEQLLNPESIGAWRYPLTAQGLPGALGRWITPVGASMGFAAELLRQLGPFDMSLRTGEEVDMAIRAQLAGHVPVYVPTSVMHYRHRADVHALARQAWAYGRGNAELYIRYRDCGAEPRGVTDLVRAGGLVVRGIPKALLNEDRRGAWLRHAAYAGGQLARGTQLRALCVG
jgi:glycosyltransferase involved in cell wall biosynthesis